MFLELLREGTVTQKFAGYDFKWDGKTITMLKDGEEIAKKDYPSLTSTQMKKMIKEFGE
jgi:hypothetical protein